MTQQASPVATGTENRCSFNPASGACASVQDGWGVTTPSHSSSSRCSSALGSRESLVTLSELDLGAERDVRVWPVHPSLLDETHCFQVSGVPRAPSCPAPSAPPRPSAPAFSCPQVTWAGGQRCFSCRSAAEKDRWIEDLRRHFQPCQVPRGPDAPAAPAPSTRPATLPARRRPHTRGEPRLQGLPWSPR